MRPQQVTTKERRRSNDARRPWPESSASPGIETSGRVVVSLDDRLRAHTGEIRVDEGVQHDGELAWGKNVVRAEIQDEGLGRLSYADVASRTQALAGIRENLIGHFKSNFSCAVGRATINNDDLAHIGITKAFKATLNTGDRVQGAGDNRNVVR